MLIILKQQKQGKISPRNTGLSKECLLFEKFYLKYFNFSFKTTFFLLLGFTKNETMLSIYTNLMAYKALMYIFSHSILTTVLWIKY